MAVKVSGVSNGRDSATTVGGTDALPGVRHVSIFVALERYWIAPLLE